MAGSKRTTSTSDKNNKKTSAAKGSRGSSSSTRGNSTRSNAGQNRTNRSGNYSRTSSAAARRREEEQRQEMQRDIILVLLFAGMVFLFLSNFGLFGMVGGAFQTIMMGILGFAAYLLPVVVFALTLYGMMNQGDQGLGARIGCIVGLYIVFAVICELVGGEVNADSALSLASIYNRCSEDHAGGGVIGGLIAWILMHTVRMAGTVLVLIVVSAICLVFVTRRSILRLMQESAIDARDRVRYRREAEAEYRNNHPDEYDDDGFLPDEEDDELTENDIAAYRRRQQEQARVERQERMREQARRDVERRHENRKEADRIFRGIVGDTDLSNDPWLRQQSGDQEAAAAAGSETVAEPIIKEPTVEESAATAENTNITNTEPVATKTEKVEEVVAAATTAAATVSAAEQLLRNQRPGTDGIQLAVASAGKGESYASEPEAVQQSVRSAIPIHRESNNMHEINVEAYQGYYASLASGSAMAEEDDEDLTSRIIREGLADLGGDENDRAAEEPAFGGARTAAADAFSRSSFTEIQHAYDADRGNMPVEPVKDIDDIEDGDDEASAEITQPTVEPAQTSAQESIHTDSSMQELQAPDAEENDAYDVVTLDSDKDEDDDAAERIEPAAPAAVLDPIEDTEDAAHAGTAGTRMGEITTPVGSGSAIAAAHARDAQIHTEATAEQTRSAATSTATTASATHAAAQPSAKPAPRKRPHKYVYPTLNLLNAGNPSKDSGSDDELRHTAEVLETTLHTFGVNCKITDISQGPAVTRYELLPEQGVKVSKVVGLSDDIKLALAAMDIRIEAPIPGKSAIGIEVPNKVTSMVALRDILSNPNFRDHKSKLAIGVGKDISGQIVVSDLAKMPHVLIAGATGSGKSVCINTIIMSILYHAAPDEVKLLMIDPKVVELSVYNGIPHLLYPVVTNPQQAATLLNWAVAEMESRYRKFADAGVRDMKGYNQMVQHELDRGNTTDPDGNPYHILPRIVVIVDELADLMMVAKNDVETAICRLAQLARAAGIHLIIATQRPSVDVITGLIKANMPSRIAFAVTSGVDSRTILDMNGAEKLLGKGDMLFFPQGLPKPARIQGAFVSDDEVMEVVSYIKDHNTVDSEEEDAIRSQMEHLGSKPQDGGQGGGGGAQDAGNGMDEYFRRAGKFIIEKDNASIGLLQRGFRIGFNRAARLMDQLCEAGVVAESEGTKSRKILMSELEFEQYCNENDIT